MMSQFQKLLDEMKSGEFKPNDWNWLIIEHSIKLQTGEWSLRTCIFVMGEGSEQCYAMIPLVKSGLREEAVSIVKEAFGVDHVL